MGPQKSIGQPLFKADDLGKPLPDMPHAISVCLPRWADVVGYEEGDSRVVNAMTTGYPRFFYHQSYRKLCDHYAKAHAKAGEFILVLPSARTAQQCIEFTGAGRVAEMDDGVALAIMPKKAEAQAKLFWQHVGQIVTSRQAEDILANRKPPDGQTPKSRITKSISSLCGAAEKDIWLFCTGMAAIFTAYEMITALRGTKTVQLGFPYVDTYKVQQKFGTGAIYVPFNGPQDLAKLEQVISKDTAAVFCEVPGNPLLRTVDLPALRKILDKFSVPLIVDDTIGTWLNVDVRPYADVVATSLTKFYSGVGNVMGGSMILNDKSPHYSALKRSAAEIYEDLVYPADAVVLAENGVTFTDRMRTINDNALKLGEFLRGHPKVANVCYPAFTDRAAYDAVRKPGGGYGGLMSFTLKDRNKAPVVYDRLTVNKGPSLGTVYTLSGPYTLLAHYNELDFAAANGVDSHLIRVSVGTEEAQDLIERFSAALEAA
ncbi:MAG TPA: PLP-dependent transferase [Patescibacteria group bacterium]|nr:PLP-dependent transferase [Patescibacteria group bacterium]